MEKNEFSVGNIVRSLKGHDTGSVYLVVGKVNRDFVLIADGRGRTVEKPKLKRAKHLRFLYNLEMQALDADDKNIDNSKVVNILKKFEGGFYA